MLSSAFDELHAKLTQLVGKSLVSLCIVRILKFLTVGIASRDESAAVDVHSLVEGR